MLIILAEGGSVQKEYAACKVYAVDRPYKSVQEAVICKIDDRHDQKSDQIVIDGPRMICILDNGEIIVLQADNGLHDDPDQGQDEHCREHPHICFRPVYLIKLHACIHRISHFLYRHLFRLVFPHSIKKIGLLLILDVGGDLLEYQRFCVFITDLFGQAF